MRKKSLLVSADAPFVGPLIYIEEGEWILGYIEEGVNVNVYVEDKGQTFMGLGVLQISGPTRVRAELVEGRNVSLDIRMIACA